MSSFPGCDEYYIVTFLVNNTQFQPQKLNDSPVYANRSANTGAPTTGLPEGYIPWSIQSSNWSFFFNGKGGSPPNAAAFPYMPTGSTGGALPACAGYATDQKVEWMTWSPSANTQQVLGAYNDFLNGLTAAKAAGKKILVSMGGFNCQQSVLTDGDQTAGPGGNVYTAAELAQAIAWALCGKGTQPTGALGGNFQTQFYLPDAGPSTPFFFDGVDIDIEHAGTFDTPGSPGTSYANIVTFAQTLKGLECIVTMPPQAPQLLYAPSDDPSTALFKNLADVGPVMYAETNAIGNSPTFPSLAEIATVTTGTMQDNDRLFQTNGSTTYNVNNLNAIFVQFYNQGYAWLFNRGTSAPTVPAPNYTNFSSQVGQWARLLYLASSPIATKLYIGLSNGYMWDPASGQGKGQNFYQPGAPGQPDVPVDYPFPPNSTACSGGDMAQNAAYIAKHIGLVVADVASIVTADDPSWFGGIMSYTLPDANQLPRIGSDAANVPFAGLIRAIASQTGGSVAWYDGANSGDPAMSNSDATFNYVNEANTNAPQTGIAVTWTGIYSVNGATSGFPSSISEGQVFLVRTEAGPSGACNLKTTGPVYVYYNTAKTAALVTVGYNAPGFSYGSGITVAAADDTFLNSLDVRAPERGPRWWPEGPRERVESSNTALIWSVVALAVLVLIVVMRR